LILAAKSEKDVCEVVELVAILAGEQGNAVLAPAAEVVVPVEVVVCR
jgi:hypothetical protein